jgi:ACS family glucarate transporter-like MFS transporter/ACS family D-galactonate transporter-like MFS transporter
MSHSPPALSEHDIGESPTNVRYQVLGLLAVAATISYIARYAQGVAESTIRGEMQLTKVQSGWLLGAFYMSYALLQIPGGRLAQQIGTRKTLTLFAVVWSAAAVCIAFARDFWTLFAAILLLGAAQAGVFPSMCYSISHWMPLSRRSLACSLLAAGMQVGAILTAVMTGPLMKNNNIGWRGVYLLYAIPGFLWAVWFLLRFHDDPASDGKVNDAERRLIQSGGGRSADGSTSRAPTPWGAILRSRTVWFLCLQQMCRAASAMFFASWFPTFLQNTRGMSISDSGYRQALVFAGNFSGALCGGMVADWIFLRTGNLRVSRAGVGVTCLFACASLIVGAWFVKDANLAIALLACGAFCAALAGPSAYVATIDIAGEHVPQVFGLMNMMGNLATAACPILIARFFERNAQWDLALLMFAGLYVIGAVCWLFVDPRKKIAA